MAFFGMARCCVLAVMFVLFVSVAARGKNDTSPTITPTKTVSPTPVSQTVSPTPATKHSLTTPTTPGSHSTAPPTTQGSQSTGIPTKSGNYSTVSPTPGNHTAEPTTRRNHSSKTPSPGGHGKGGHGDSRGKWVAAAFAIFFAITTIVMTVLYCRQRKIYRELEGDSSLSRLI